MSDCVKAINPFSVAENYKFDLPNDVIEPWLPETYAQCGEDLIMRSLLDAWTGSNSDHVDGIYVDIGAAHPIQISNTYLLYKTRSMRGVVIDADADRRAQFAAVRPGDIFVHAAVTTSRDAETVLHVANARELSSLDPEHANKLAGACVVSQVTVPNLHINDVLERCPAGGFYLLSVDAEGMDYEILAAIDYDRFEPLIIVAEHFAASYPDNPRRFCELLTRAGYTLAGLTAQNLIFMRQDDD